MSSTASWIDPIRFFRENGRSYTCRFLLLFSLKRFHGLSALRIGAFAYIIKGALPAGVRRAVPDGTFFCAIAQTGGIALQQRTSGGVTFFLTRRQVKNLNLRVRMDGSVAVSAPMRTPLREVDGFVAAHAGWVVQAQQRMAARREADAALPVPDRIEALAGMRALVERWWPAFAPRCPGPMPAVRVREMRTRWGSCSLRTRTLCFALKLWAMPQPAREYVAVHELCHLLHPDHSPAFWAEVARCLPDYQARRALLRAPR